MGLIGLIWIVCWGSAFEENGDEADGAEEEGQEDEGGGDAGVWF
jgi:hypothetical protein